MIFNLYFLYKNIKILPKIFILKIIKITFEKLGLKETVPNYFICLYQLHSKLKLKRLNDFLLYKHGVFQPFPDHL
jgi:hypothetical protein